MVENSGRASRMTAQTLRARLYGALRLLLYGICGAALLLFDVLIVMLIYRYVEQYVSGASVLLTALAAALGAMSFLPLFARARRLLDTAFYHDTYDLSVVLQEYSQQFGALSDQESITRFLLDSLEKTVNLADLAYVALPEGLDAGVMQVLEAGDIRARGLYATEAGKAMMLSGLAHLTDETEELLRQKKALRKPWPGCEALIVIETVPSGSVDGLLVVGPKRNGGSLQRKDRSLLVTVAHLVGTAFANALLIQGLHVSLRQVQTSTNQMLAARAELKLLLRELVSAEERERSALARDLHDDALQEVLYVIRHAQFCTRLAGELEASWRGAPVSEAIRVAGRHPTPPLERAARSSAERLQGELAQLAHRAQVLEQKLRALCMGLYPETLRVLGLPVALEELASQVTQTTGMSVSVFYEDDAGRAAEDLMPERAVHLYRIAQEALTNAGKHANSTSSLIYLSLLATLPGRGGHTAETSTVLWVCLTIIDNGGGMPLPLDMGALVQNGHLGLAGMRERAEQLGGRLDIRREPSGGTRVMIMSPLSEQPLSAQRIGHLGQLQA